MREPWGCRIYLSPEDEAFLDQLALEPGRRERRNARRRTHYAERRGRAEPETAIVCPPAIVPQLPQVAQVAQAPPLPPARGMRVVIGSGYDVIGVVEASPEGLVYMGRDPERVREIVEGQRVWHHRNGESHELSDAVLVHSLPYRLQGVDLWADFADERAGRMREWPTYEPWGGRASVVTNDDIPF